MFKGRQTGGFQTGWFPDLDLSFLFCPVWDFPDFFGIFPICSGWSGDFPVSSLFPFSANEEHLRGTVPKGSATQSGPFPKKVGNPPVWKPPGLACPNLLDPYGIVKTKHPPKNAHANPAARNFALPDAIFPGSVLEYTWFAHTIWMRFHRFRRSI